MIQRQLGCFCIRVSVCLVSFIGTRNYFLASQQQGRWGALCASWGQGCNENRALCVGLQLLFSISTSDTSNYPQADFMECLVPFSLISVVYSSLGL